MPWSCPPIRASRWQRRTNSLAGPNLWTVDLAAVKRLMLPWRVSNVELRFEAFNLFNRTNFMAPNANRSATAFGTITRTYDPRQLQLGVKVNF